MQLCILLAHLYNLPHIYLLIHHTSQCQFQCKMVATTFGRRGTDTTRILLYQDKRLSFMKYVYLCIMCRALDIIYSTIEGRRPNLELGLILC